MGRRRKIKIDKFWYKVIKIFLLFTFLIIGGYLLVVNFYKIKYFSIRRIESNFPLDKSINDKLIGYSIFKVDLENLYQRIVAKHPDYRDIRILKKLPSTLEIKGYKRIPFVQLKLEDKYIVIDKDYYVLEESDQEKSGLVLIYISDIKKHNKGDMIEDLRIIRAFQLIDYLKITKIMGDYKVREIIAYQLGNLSFKIGNIDIIMGDGDYDKKIVKLKKILNSELRDRFSSILYIDLRSHKPYLGYRR